VARSLEPAGPIELLENAAHLMRGASLDTLLCHAIGGAPLALFLLVFWNSATHPPVSDAVVAAEALAAALLLVWMNCWRSVFAGRLHCSLTGAPRPQWDGRRVWRLVSTQAIVAGTKLLVLPISLVAVFPLVTVISFYRNASVLAGQGELDPFDALAKARRLARGEQVQGWLIQFLFLLLSTAAVLNVAATMILLPQLVRMLTGYESAFTRGGESFFLNRLFLLAVLAVTWLLFDPFVQAVYCLRCFGRESEETGEDLRAALRRVRSSIARGGTAAAIAAALLLSAAPARAASISPRDLEQAVRQTMQSPEYNWRIPPPPTAASSTPWIITATDRAIQAFRAAVKWVGRSIERLLRWIFGGLGVSPMPASGQAPSAALHWSVWVLIGLALASVAWVAWRAFAARRRKPRAAASPAASPVHVDDETLAAGRLPEAEWLEMAEQCLRDGDLRRALRAFYLANLAWLASEQLLTPQSGKTNRDFEIELRRRAPESPEARALFAANVRAFERAWYGLYEVDEEDALGLRSRAAEMKSMLCAGVAP
jgi:hypothetical protein